MADVHNLISLGLGSPASIPHFILVGLSINDEVIAAQPTASVRVLAESRTVRVRAESRSVLVPVENRTVRVQRPPRS